MSVFQTISGRKKGRKEFEPIVHFEDVSIIQKHFTKDKEVPGLERISLTIDMILEVFEYAEDKLKDAEEANQNLIANPKLFKEYHSLSSDYIHQLYEVIIHLAKVLRQFYFFEEVCYKFEYDY